MPVIPALGRLRQEDTKFKDRLSYIVILRPARTGVRFCLKKKLRK